MYKKTIEFEDFDGNLCKEDKFFHLSETELAEMELSTDGGMVKLLEKIVNEKDNSKIVEYFKMLILKSYGEKSLDGKSFIKVDSEGHPLSIAFSQTAAYDALFMELATNADKAAAFVNGILPKKFQKDNLKEVIDSANKLANQ